MPILVNEFKLELNAKLEGNNPGLPSFSTPKPESQIFSKSFAQAINRISFKNVKESEILACIQNAGGFQPELFIPEIAFRAIVKTLILKLEKPCIECSEIVREELRKAIISLNIPKIQKYILFSQKLQQVMEGILLSCLKPTQEMIKNLIKVEHGYTNTMNKDFVNDISKIMKESSLSDEDENENGFENEKSEKSEKSDKKSEKGEKKSDISEKSTKKRVEPPPDAKKSSSFFSWFSKQGQDKSEEEKSYPTRT